MLIYLLFLFFVVCLVKDFKKGIIYYAPFKFMFSHGIPSHIGTFELDVIFTFVLFCFWLFNRRKDLLRFPLKISFVFMMLASFAFALNPFFSIKVLLESLSPYLYLVMFFSAIETKGDISTFIKVICVYVLILNVNAVCEMFGSNIIGNQLLTIMTPGAYWAVDAGTRGSFFRLHSFVPHSIGFGVENMVFFSFFFMLYMYRQDLMKKKTSIYYMTICLLGVFLSGSRSPLLGGIIMLLPFLANKKMFNARNISFVVIAALMIVVFAGEYISTMFDSLTTDKDTDLGGASSWDMRLGQLEYSIYFWMKNFWFGNGHTFDIFQGGRMYSEIFGAESVWFPIMMKQGMVGMIAYLSVTVDSCIRATKIKYKWLCVCLMLGWLVIDTATNLPGLSILLPLYFYVIYYKMGSVESVSCDSIKKY